MGAGYPAAGDPYLGLAKAFFKEGDLIEALDALERALRVDPSNREADSRNKELKIIPDDTLSLNGTINSRGRGPQNSIAIEVNVNQN